MSPEKGGIALLPTRSLAVIVAPLKKSIQFQGFSIEDFKETVKCLYVGTKPFKYMHTIT